MKHTKIDWVKKLTSRKFWAAIVSVVLCSAVIFGINEVTMQQISALIMAVGTLIAYILGEGFVDANAAKSESNDEKKGE